MVHEHQDGGHAALCAEAQHLHSSRGEESSYCVALEQKVSVVKHMWLTLEVLS